MSTILSIAKTTLGEAIRRRVLLIILLVGILLLVVAPGLNILTARSSFTTLTSFTLGVIKMTAALIAVVLTVYLIPNEIDRRTIYTILSKPVLRWQFLIGKYLGAVAAMALMIAMMTGIFIGVFYILKGDSASASVYADLAKGPLATFIQMSILAAVAIFFSTFVSPIVNFFLSGGVFVLGTIMSPLFQDLSGNADVNPVAKYAATFIHTVVPNFAQFDIQNSIINTGTAIRAEGFYFLQLFGYAIAYIGILLIAGILIFDKREI